MYAYEYAKNEGKESEHVNMSDNGDSKRQEKIKQHMSLDKKYKGALPTFSVWIVIKT